jgi:hypothetical protein
MDLNERLKAENRKSKSSMEKMMRNILDAHTKGVFRDNHWAPVQAIQKELSEELVDLTLVKAEYYHGKNHEPEGKIWLFEIPYQDKGGWYLRIVANFGPSSPKDPTEKYDLVYTLSWSAKVKAASVISEIQKMERKFLY